MRITLVVGLVAAAVGCGGASTGSNAPDPLPTWVFDPAAIFPADRSLARPEDGVALPDGRLIVADQRSGLRMVETSGSHEPFGDLAGAGYVNEPPAAAGAPNGVSLEPGGTHLLVTDVYGGGIYRVAVSDGATERVYRHAYGVNAAVGDSMGAIWFTQSTENPPDNAEARLFETFDDPVPDGVLLRLPPGAGPDATAEVVLGDLNLANGLALDEEARLLYVAETLSDRVLRFSVNVEAGTVGEPTVFAEVASPDNVELDGEGRLWIASPLRSEVVVAETQSGVTQSVFRMVTPVTDARVAEFVRRGAAGEPRLELFGPDLWGELPGPVTGLILSGADGPVYLTTIGDAMVRLDRP